MGKINFGVLKPFKPMRFHNAGWYSDNGFRRHGIWEIVGKWRRATSNKWCVKIRRIASARMDCRIGEEFDFPEEYLISEMFYDPEALSAFR